MSEKYESKDVHFNAFYLRNKLFTNDLLNI